ncbi:MAG: S41 family peptidase [Desulfotomaculaceae bacterium]|nr:S41 family peptidase [Desulfotomaculaceae bacterium]
MRKVYLVLVMTLVIALGFAAPSPAADNPAMGMETFEEVLENIQSLHLNEPDPGDLLEGAIDGLINSLKDPYTEYMSPGELEKFNETINGDYAGVGIQLEPGEHYPKAIGTIKNTPAEKAGIMPLDLIIKVDSADIFDQPLGEVVQKIRGPEGTKVRLTIRRAGAGDFELELVRANINNPTVSWQVLEDSSGYIRINSFGSNTFKEFEQALAGLKEQGATGLILDLRDNPGGLLETAVEIAGAFVGPGQVAVSTVDRHGDRDVHRTEGAPAGAGLRVVALINQYSASASEILAGALQDHHAATLVGSQTYGKGTVQIVKPLDAGGALKLTVAKYLTPGNREINGTGLSPDYQVTTPALQALAARRLLTPAPNTLQLELGQTVALVRGETVQMRQSMLQYNGTIYLPLRFTFEALGYRVDWQPADGSVKISGYGYDAVYCTRDGECSQSAPGVAPLLTKDGEAFIPLAELGNFGINYLTDGSKIFIDK